jgi:FtsP/CotA-like multicopper oxidase with cupredoxin domain
MAVRGVCFGGVVMIAAALGLPAAPAQAQTTQAPTAPPRGLLDCAPLLDQPLRRIPELIAENGVLRGTVVLSSEQQRIAFRTPPGLGNVPGMPGLYFVCQPQYVRTFRGVDARPAMPVVGANDYPNPMPGPTLRARVGDVVALTLLNHVNPSDFGDSIDRAERGIGTGCDESTAGYPQQGGDSFPDCFHGSSTGNIHFHGTHTNPNSTGDNVFLEIRPSPRENGRPTVTAASVKDQFNAFFAECERQLKRNVLSEWPTSWTDRPLGPPDDPSTWTAEQRRLLEAYDAGKPHAQQLWPVDRRQLESGQWPQYYIGAYPYCFRLPDYTDPAWPPPRPAASAAMPMRTERALQMGQAPGMHWYHAHKHGSTAINVANGMTGAFIVEGKYDDELDAFYGAGWMRRQPVLVINQLGVSPNLMRSGSGKGATDKGPDFSVNGTLHPVLEMRPGEVQLWRVLNSSGRSGAYFGGPPAGFEWRQLAQDGVQFADVNYQRSRNKAFLMAAGNRADLLVKAPATAGSYAVEVRHEVDPSDLPSAFAVTLVTVKVTGDPVSGAQAQFIPRAPGLPPFLADITDDEVTGTKTIVFASTPPGTNAYGMHTIDGKKFSDETGAVVLLNKVEEWKIVNRSFGPPISHPFHIHVNPFQITEIFDPNQPLIVDPATGVPQVDPNSGDPYPKYVFYRTQPLQTVNGVTQCYVDPDDPATWKPCDKESGGPRIWWDVFPIPSGQQVTVNGKTTAIPGYFKMRSRFVDFPGLFVMHCHILAHEDRGMMTIVEVVPLKPPVSHH